MLQALDKFHKTRTGYLVFGLVELGLAYLFLSLAINSGSLWEYFLGIVFLIGFLRNLINLVRKLAINLSRVTKL